MSKFEKKILTLLGHGRAVSKFEKKILTLLGRGRGPSSVKILTLLGHGRGRAVSKFETKILRFKKMTLLGHHTGAVFNISCTRAEVILAQENLARVVNAAPLYFFENTYVNACARRCKILIYFEVYAPRI